MVVLGAIAANLMAGDPVWLMLVGPSGGGKTEILRALGSLADTYTAATINEAGLLSGSSQKDKPVGASGGLLQRIGKFGFLILKDFTSVLSMHHDARTALLAALREVFDGSWTRHLGVDGGRTLSWSGKLALITACTGTIDSHHAVMASMGERFCLYRLPAIDEDTLAARALAHLGQEDMMRRELAAAVADLFARVKLPAEPPPLVGAEQARLIALSRLAVRCRSAVERDPYTRQITLVLAPESPSRLALVLAQLLAGMTVIGVEREEAWRLLVKVGLDCMPAVRRSAFELLTQARAKGGLDTSEIASELGYPPQTARRALEDLTAHGVLHRDAGGSGKPDRWDLTDWARELYAAAQGSVPEKSAANRA
jgi:hypothetical protein